MASRSEQLYAVEERFTCEHCGLPIGWWHEFGAVQVVSVKRGGWRVYLWCRLCKDNAPSAAYHGPFPPDWWQVEQ